MCNLTPSATFHVSPDIKPETRRALVEMMVAVARHYGIETPIETTFVERDDPDFVAARLSENSWRFDNVQSQFGRTESI